jgi:hypothetical protein
MKHLITPALVLLAGSIQPGTINPYPTIGAIPHPAGYHRLTESSGSFGAWLRQIPLKKDRTVYLYNGSRKRNQDAQFAVLDVSVGHTDLQQCADAVMRLRAEYLFSVRNYGAIGFTTAEGVRLNFLEWCNGQRYRLSGDHLAGFRTRPVDFGNAAAVRSCFDVYLTAVFTWCGTQTLEKQLITVGDFNTLQPGDVLIKGGSPGHAMLVADVAIDAAGHRIYLLVQSYMPAQDIHLVINPTDPAISPWYRADQPPTLIQTPEWTFTINQLRTWPLRY